jgi:hypothetical protein
MSSRNETQTTDSVFVKLNLFAIPDDSHFCLRPVLIDFPSAGNEIRENLIDWIPYSGPGKVVAYKRLAAE